MGGSLLFQRFLVPRETREKIQTRIFCKFLLVSLSFSLVKEAINLDKFRYNLLFLLINFSFVVWRIDFNRKLASKREAFMETKMSMRKNYPSRYSAYNSLNLVHACKYFCNIHVLNTRLLIYY